MDFKLDAMSELTLDWGKTAKKLSNFIGHILRQSSFSRLVVGLSGGVDSATAVVLAIKAIKADNIFVGLFPYGEMGRQALSDAYLIVKKFHIPSANIVEIDIGPLIEPIIGLDPAMDNLRRGNIMARMRMILLYDLAKKNKGLVLGTENRTEYLLGYFTLFGDAASDIEPIISLYKTQVRELAAYLGIPKSIIEKEPSADLWFGQTDEKEFGFSYREADQILHLYIDKKKSREEIAALGIEKNIIDKVLARWRENRFKHQLPYKLFKK